MDCDIYEQQRKEYAGMKQDKQDIRSDGEGLGMMFSDNQVVSAWRELPDKERLILLLVDLRHLGVEKVAEIMNKPVATIKKEVGRARTMVRKKILSDLQRD